MVKGLQIVCQPNQNNKSKLRLALRKENFFRPGYPPFFPSGRPNCCPIIINSFKTIHSSPFSVYFFRLKILS